MTMIEQIALANEKVSHWNAKRDHALAMLAKWESRLTALQAKGKPVPTANLLPPLSIVPGSVKHMPRQAVVTKADKAAAEHLARQTALADFAAEAGDGNVTSIKGKPANGKKPKKH